MKRERDRVDRIITGLTWAVFLVVVVMFCSVWCFVR